MTANNSNKILYYSIAKTAMGWIGIAGNEEGLRKIFLPEDTKDNVLTELKRYFRFCNKLTQAAKRFDSKIEKIKKYFDGQKIQFDKITINLEGYTSFQQDVLLTTMEIPYGTAKTYKWLAEHAGYPKAYRAVGGVMRINPLPLIIPCHRVIGSHGNLTGFSAAGGLKLKRKMLELEGIFLKEWQII